MSKTISKAAPILIVGAGPTGLTAAATLAKFGIPVRIIDKNSARSEQSKAIAVQAGTLECLDHALDPRVTQKMLVAGYPVRQANVHVEDRDPVSIDLSTIPSVYNFILVLAQSETERILEEHLNSLGVKVERGVELISLLNEHDQVTSTLLGPNGAEEILPGPFVVGCDGAHSAVRHALKSKFVGDAYQGDFILGDVQLNWPWPYGEVHAFISERGIVAAFPLKGNQNYRLILVPKNSKPPTDSPEIKLEEFRKILDVLSLGKITVNQASWMTRFRVSHRMVRSFQQGRVFLAGDAAHIHSPAGGQGMNTGIQDALNLSYKLKSVIQGGSFNLLGAYQKERLPVARGVLRATDFFSRAMLLPENSFTGFARREILPRLAGTRWIQRRVIKALSQVEIAHREIAGYE